MVRGRIQFLFFDWGITEAGGHRISQVVWAPAGANRISTWQSLIAMVWGKPELTGEAFPGRGKPDLS